MMITKKICFGMRPPGTLPKMDLVGKKCKTFHPFRFEIEKTRDCNEADNGVLMISECMCVLAKTHSKHWSCSVLSCKLTDGKINNH